MGTPPAWAAGKYFNTRRPRFQARWISLAVVTPGMTGTAKPAAADTTPSCRPGDTMNLAPAATAVLACAAFNTVPAPTVASGTAAQAAFGAELHVLVNITGGLVARRGLAEMDEAFLNEVMRLNLNSTFLATKHVAPHMADGGAIVNCASQAGRDGGGPGAAAYATAKGAVMTFTRAMAKELGARNIRVNAICPGMIDTTFHDTFTADAVRTKVAGGTALGREGEASEVGRLVAWLASADASYVTGANFDVNGGAYFA